MDVEGDLLAGFNDADSGLPLAVLLLPILRLLNKSSSPSHASIKLTNVN